MQESTTAKRKKAGVKIRLYNTKEITDSERAEAVLAGVMGKRLTYRTSSMAV